LKKLVVSSDLLVLLVLFITIMLNKHFSCKNFRLIALRCNKALSTQ